MTEKNKINKKKIQTTLDFSPSLRFAPCIKVNGVVTEDNAVLRFFYNSHEEQREIADDECISEKEFLHVYQLVR